jgi:predicted neuraminidase
MRTGIRMALLGLLALGAVSEVHAAGDLTITRVFGPEVTTGPYKHPAAITELDNGDLYLVYYGGQGEYARDTAVFGARRQAGTTTWSAPQVLARDPFRSVGNAVIWQAPDQVVWLFYVVRYGETWSSSRIQAKISNDRAVTWSDPFPIALDAGMMVRNRPIVLAEGGYLLPVYLETGEDTEQVGPDSTSRFLYFDPATRAWTERGAIRSRTGNIQPAVVELSPGHLIAYCRRGGNYAPTEQGWTVRAESKDGGRTWTEGQASAFRNPNSALEFLKLQNGHLLLVFNDHMWKRTPLVAALSTDGDRTYPHRRIVGDADNTYAYPIGFQARDGSIHIVYTSDSRAVINHAVFDEAWVRGTPPVY